MEVFQDIKKQFNPYHEHGLDCEVRLVIKDMVKDEFTHLNIIKPNESIEFENNQFDSHLLYKYKYQVKVDKKWADETKYQNIVNEQQTPEGIKYIYFPGVERKKSLFKKRQPKKLIVVFQGIKDLNRTTYYNYIKTLKDFDEPRLYIKDDYGTDENTQTSYYLGANKTFTIADNVLNLIESTRNTLNINKNNVICAGSSKGGFAALYFSHKGSYGYAIAGGPQILIGNYLSKGKIDGHEEKSILPPILRYLCEEITYENIEWANNILFNEISKTKHQPMIYLHVGKNEPHYEKHVYPLMNFMKENKRDENIALDLPDYSTHKELALHFPEFLIESVQQIVKSK